MSSHYEFTITETDQDEFSRLDTFLTNKLPDISRSLLKKFFLDGAITSSIKLELKKLPPSGTNIHITIPELTDPGIIAQDIPIEVIYEDEYLLIVNKQAGLVVHPAPGNFDGTLVNAIVHRCPDLKGIGNEKRPGIVHRLDKGTSGVMVVAKEQKTHEGLVKLFSTHDITRKYQAIVLGARIPGEKTLESTIGRSPNNRLKMEINTQNGKKAITHMLALEFFKSFSHLELKLETGRTHQIRVHLSQILNTPILNDSLYGRANDEKHILSTRLKGIIKNYEHPFLHAKTLGFVHPITKKELLFETSAPQIFQDVLNELRDERTF